MMLLLYFLKHYIPSILFILYEVVQVQSCVQQQLMSENYPMMSIVTPRMYQGREGRQIFTTKQETNDHINHVTITIPLNGEELLLDLTLNKELIRKGYVVQTQSKTADGTQENTYEEVCQYNGQVRGKPDSWIALSTCNGVSAIIYDGEQMYYLEKCDTKDDFRHLLYTQSESVRHHNEDQHRIKRSLKPIPQIRGPYNSDANSKYVELMFVVDNGVFRQFNRSVAIVENYCKDLANALNGVYNPLNIFIALVGVVIWTEKDIIDFDHIPSDSSAIDMFVDYQDLQLSKTHHYDNVQLLTKYENDNVIGRATLDTICIKRLSAAWSNVYSSTRPSKPQFDTVAHEMGHNLGMDHDEKLCSCIIEGKCIMEADVNDMIEHLWSSCSIAIVKENMKNGKYNCLRNKPTSLFGGPVCGNTFVEEGEECDCGLQAFCKNKCCNATTCKLNADSICATGKCCDLETCQIKPESTVCRASADEFDLPEYCTGFSEYCPNDFYKMNNKSCNNKKDQANNTCPDNCSKQCNNNGVCNNLGHCHCNVGFAPPDCYGAGNGGSEDSGPPPILSGLSLFRKVVIIFFCSLLVIGVVALFVWCYVCRNIQTRRTNGSMAINLSSTEDDSIESCGNDSIESNGLVHTTQRAVINELKQNLNKISQASDTRSEISVKQTINQFPNIQNTNKKEFSRTTNSVDDPLLEAIQLPTKELIKKYNALSEN